MRIALISDIHGNALALDAVLRDCTARGVEEYWFVGDYAAIGPEPGAVLERVTSLDKARFLRGNTDRYVVTGEGPPPSLDAVRRDPELIPTYAGIAASMAWTRGFVTASGYFEWLAALPLETRATTPGGTRLLAVHAAPGRDDGEGVHRGRGNDALAALIATAEADLIVVGHTHEPMIRRVGSTHVVNLGSVSNPRTEDRRACYVELEVGDTGVEIEHRRVGYDVDEFARRVERSRHPSADFILGYQRGEQLWGPPHPDHIPLRPGERTRVTSGEGR